MTLKRYLRHDLDVLFVALNPPKQSDANGHWFSGTGSRFFKLLADSGLITRQVDRTTADELVFGGTELNFASSAYGVVDLKPDTVETNSNLVRTRRDDAIALANAIREFRPRFVCVIHSKVMKALRSQLEHPLRYGINGRVLRSCDCVFVANYFPNGNKICDDTKVEIFRELKSRLR